MAILYKGAGVGTYWHTNDACATGFTPMKASAPFGVDRLMRHVARGDFNSPYVSLTLSYGVAFSYALLGKARPTTKVPAYVYEIEVGGHVSTRASLADPVKEVAEAPPAPTAAINYQHDGDPDFILGVANPNTMWRRVQRPIKQPPGSVPTPKTPTLTIELETLIRALRDAEILVEGGLPASCIRARNVVS